MFRRVVAAGSALALVAVCAAACGGRARADLPEVAGQPVTAAASAVGTPSAPRSPVRLDCDDVMVAVWPSAAEVPTAPGWDGPRCVEDDGVSLTWVSVAGDVTPESADAAFVELQSGFERAGWDVSEPRPAADPEGGGQSRAAACALRAPGGALAGVMTYRPMDIGRASLEVAFTA